MRRNVSLLGKQHPSKPVTPADRVMSQRHHADRDRDLTKSEARPLNRQHANDHLRAARQRASQDLSDEQRARSVAYNIAHAKDHLKANKRLR